jgi:large subunit ribosomal protein L15
MNISDLQKVKAKSKKRVGQGHGSGRGKTSGRGTKGTKARYKVALNFEGGALPLTKRLPFLRGKGRNPSLKPDAIVLNVSALNAFTKGATVDVASLAKQGLVALEEARLKGVKILGDGELTVAVTVKLPTSKGAAEKITKAGGSVDQK